jgi:DNA-binding winged helix-turn-helix (wHTH) protein
MTHRFGNFTFDTETRELRRDGVQVRLQAQPAEVLCALLANPGQVVSRAALRDAVWGNNGTNVDFESGLNFCIAQLRSALGDSADSSIYIKTVPKQGYQFVAPVSAPPPPPPPPPRLQWSGADPCWGSA